MAVCLTTSTTGMHVAISVNITHFEDILQQQLVVLVYEGQKKNCEYKENHAVCVDALM